MKHLKLITEQSYEIVSEKTEDHKLYITGVYSSADVRNINGRIYKRDLLEREISRLLSTKIKYKSATGELGHPDRPDTTLDLAAILTESLEWQGNHVIGKSRVLTKLPKGEVLSALIEEGVLVGISSRGLGTVSNEGFVNEDLQILTWDCVRRVQRDCVEEGDDWRALSQDAVRSDCEHHDAGSVDQGRCYSGQSGNVASAAGHSLC